MKELVILSGKGGAGKTTITAALSKFLLNNDVIVDADVDAADMHILLEPEIITKKDFYSGKEPEINNKICNLCGICVEKCPYNALYIDNNKVMLKELDCEGCSFCKYACPHNAIKMREKLVGIKYISNTKSGIKMSHAMLLPGEENSGKLVSSVRQDGRIILNEQKGNILLIDGPPGIGCNTISAVTNSDLAILIIESTISGFHDIQRMITLLEHFKINACAIINKYGLNHNLDKEIITFLIKENIPIIGQIPYDKKIIDSLKNKQILSEYNTEYHNKFEKIFKEITKII